MRQVDVGVPAFARRHDEPSTVEIKADVFVGDDWDVNPNLTVVEIQRAIDVFGDIRAGVQAKQPDGLQRTAERGEHLAKVSAPGEQLGVAKGGDVGRVRNDVVGGTGDRAQRGTAPFTVVVLPVDVRDPFLGADERQIGAKTVGVEVERKLKTAHAENEKAERLKD